MKFYMPVKVYDEKDCVSAHAKELASFGKRALIVTGKRSSYENGSYDDVTGALSQYGTEYLTFSDVEENPSTDTVFAARSAMADEGIDFVIGIGGGSALDAAKAIALVLAHPEADLEYLYDTSKDPSALPVVCVPTTCGTGSEVTGVSVLTRHDKKTKISMVHKVFPALALIDGKYIAYASRSLLVNSAVDALSHLYESALNSKADDYVSMIASYGLTTWAKIKDVVAGDKEPGDEERSLLMRASTLAGMSIAQCGTSLPHALSYVITYDLSIAHGKAVGYFLPGFLAAAGSKERDRLLKLSGFAGLDDFASYMDKVFGKIDIPKEELDKTFEAVKSNKSKMNSASFSVDEDVLKKIVYEKVIR